MASTTKAGNKSSFSNLGGGVIDVAAPGSSILSTVTGGGYGFKSGTTMDNAFIGEGGVDALDAVSWLRHHREGPGAGPSDRASGAGPSDRHTVLAWT
ncbi:MAG: hypothetical protein ACYDDU_05460 [Dermatophilaceae bacterium]